jgi:hypothetical protein
MITPIPYLVFSGSGAASHELKKSYRDFFRTITRPINAIIAANTGNPMEFAGEVADVIDAEVNPVEYSRTLPASILMVVEKSWYPAFVILSTCVPAANPEIIAGLIPFTSLSTETSAPAGVVVIESEPVESELVDCPWIC